MRKLVLLLACLALSGLALAESRPSIICEGGTFTYRNGKVCQTCHFTSCCVQIADGTISCSSTEDWCEDCGAGGAGPV